MKRLLIVLSVATAGLNGCAATSRSAAKLPPFECTSIYPEICELEQEFHKLRHQHAEQNAAIEAAERRRKAREQVTG